MKLCSLKFECWIESILRQNWILAHEDERSASEGSLHFSLKISTQNDSHWADGGGVQTKVTLHDFIAHSPYYIPYVYDSLCSTMYILYIKWQQLRHFNPRLNQDTAPIRLFNTSLKQATVH
jgi:hypothetical protein